MNLSTVTSGLLSLIRSNMAQERHINGAHCLGLDGTFIIEFCENMPDPDESVDSDKRVNIYRIILESGWFTGYFDQIPVFLYTMGEASNAFEGKMSARIAGDMLLSHVFNLTMSLSIK